MGPLQGLRIIEFAGIGPAPFACMVLADMGAEIIRIDRARPGALSHGGSPHDILSRGRRSIAVDLKKSEGLEVALRLIDGAEALIEGFRPGVMEGLGLGPEVCRERNARLVYARMTGWGQDGPLAEAAGHDMNYIALSGALHAIGREEGGPAPPLNLIGDFGGGAMYLVAGVLAGVLRARESGQGQVVDAAIVDGVASLMAPIYGFFALGMWQDERRANMLDGGAPYYDTYQCADGEWISIASIEPQFYELLAEKLEIDLGPADLPSRLDKSRWPELKKKITEAVAKRTQKQWCELLEGSDVCFAPVLKIAEAKDHPHNKARGVFFERDGVTQPAPAPRFTRTPSEAGAAPQAPGGDSRALMAELGYDEKSSQALLSSGAVVAAD